MISMDVPPHPELKGIKPILFVIIYQMYLAIAFLIGGPIGAWMTRKMVTIFQYNPPYFNKINSSQNYPYYYLWKNVVKSIFNKNKRLLNPKYRPSMPIVYLYAEIKPFQFHGPKWTKWINENKERGCEIHGLQYNHWIMKKFPKFVTELIVRKLK